MVVQGPDKLDNEMCMFEAFYYPIIPRENGGQAFEDCIQTPLPGGVGDQFGSGSKSCSESLSCIRSCPPGQAPIIVGDGVDVGACWQSCMVDSCPTASAPLDALTYCVLEQCASQCIGGSGCNACVISKCALQYRACQAHYCSGERPWARPSALLPLPILIR
jgi:hypothetical protein